MPPGRRVSRRRPERPGSGGQLSPTLRGQTSAAINPGNSGGALIDLAGEVVGIPTLAALDPEFSDTPANGIGFAITSNAAVDVAEQLIANGKVVTPPEPNASAAVGQ